MLVGVTYIFLCCRNWEIKFQSDILFFVFYMMGKATKYDPNKFEVYLFYSVILLFCHLSEARSWFYFSTFNRNFIFGDQNKVSLKPRINGSCQDLRVITRLGSRKRLSVLTRYKTSCTQRPGKFSNLLLTLYIEPLHASITPLACRQSDNALEFWEQANGNSVRPKQTDLAGLELRWWISGWKSAREPHQGASRKHHRRRLYLYRVCLRWPYRSRS